MVMANRRTLNGRRVGGRVLRCALVLLYASIPAIAASPSPPQGSSSMEEMRQKMMEMLGQRAPARAQAGDAIEVVVQTGHAAAITAVAVSDDGKSVASGGMDGAVKLWDVASGEAVRTFSGDGLLWPSAVALTRDGERLLVSDAESARVYDASSGALLSRVATGDGLLLLAGDGTAIAGNAMVGERRELTVMDTATGRTTANVPARPGMRA